MALARCREITVVKDALVARQAGPVTAMHDATEGGVLGGLWEIAEASGVGMEADARQMLWPEDVAALCELLEIDPLAAIAEGSLLITVPATSVPAVIDALGAEHIPCTRIGTVLEDSRRRVLTRRDGREEGIAAPREDPFWAAFFAGIEGWRETGD
jgi:hydrogenase maturation factor